MRTNIDIDQTLMKEAMEATGLQTEEATIEEALRNVIKSAARRRALRELEGMGWEGDLDQMRRDWSPPEQL